MLVILNSTTGEISYSNASHPPAIILRADGAIEFLPITDLPIGVMSAVDYEEAQAYLNPEDKLLLYTDGITEARTDIQMFGIEGIEQTLIGHNELSAEQIADKLIDAATAWAGGKLRDDTAILVVERLGENTNSTK